MKDRIFIIITILFFLVIYTSDKVVLMTLEAKNNKSNINTLQTKVDSLKTANTDLYNYSIKLEKICDKYKSSRDAKYNYHLKSNIILN